MIVSRKSLARSFAYTFYENFHRGVTSFVSACPVKMRCARKDRRDSIVRRTEGANFDNRFLDEIGRVSASIDPAIAVTASRRFHSNSMVFCVEFPRVDQSRGRRWSREWISTAETGRGVRRRKRVGERVADRVAGLPENLGRVGRRSIRGRIFHRRSVRAIRWNTLLAPTSEAPGNLGQPRIPNRGAIGPMEQLPEFSGPRPAWSGA